MGPLKQKLQVRLKWHRYIKVITIAGKNRKETFGTYWLSKIDDISDFCSFSMEDVLAEDWMIDE